MISIKTPSCIFQEVGVIRDLALRPSRSAHDNAIVQPFVLVMARLNLDMQMEPILRRINGTTFHQGLQDLGGTGSGAFRSTDGQLGAHTSIKLRR